MKRIKAKENIWISSLSSYNARDFLYRLHYLLEGKIENVLTDNGPEFQKYFDKACQELNIDHYFTRNHTPQDNPVNERFNQTLEEDFIQTGNFSPDPSICNPRLIEHCIDFDFKRAHQALGNIPPIEFAQKHLKNYYRCPHIVHGSDF
ncbi:MAG: integrase core domain-containing protein [Patescibacteria group bacterium]|nr:integrase core domain-containing protein [Patescibacteria group bacterium]